MSKKGDPEHRIQCSYRILIGPWDIKTPSPFRSRQTQTTNDITTASHLASFTDQDNAKANHNQATRPQPVTIQNPEQSDKNKTSTEPASLKETNSNYLSEDTFHTAHSSLLNDSDQDSDARFETSNSSTQSIVSNSSTNTIRPIHFMNTSMNPTLGVNQTDKKSETIDLSLAEQHHDQIQRRNGKQNYSGPIPKITYNNDTISDDQHEEISKPRQRKIPNYESRQTLSHSLLWRESGPIFIPSLPDTTSSSSSSNEDVTDNADTTIKHEFLLCMQLLNGDNEKLPTTYNERNANSIKRQQDWRQLEVILTQEALECYDSRGLIWPHRKLQYRISLDTQINPGLFLYILSPLDYTFCLQYTLNGKNEINTVVFRARSLTLCQEWYMALYQLLPPVSKKPFPQECEIYIPSINLRVHLPLVHEHYLRQQQEGIKGVQEDRNDARYSITMGQIKDAVVDLLQKDRVWRTLLDKHLGSHSDFSFCWTRKDRLEWIYWESSVDGTQGTDKVICPQLIENTHQLELRTVQHTPHSVILSENTTLAEPFPCEGFLTKVTDFEGRPIKTGSWMPRKFYFCAFGKFLFAVPSHKAQLPNPSTYMDPVALKHSSNAKLSPCYSNRVKNSPYVTLVTPYAGNKDHISHSWQYDEIYRRMHLISAATGCINLAEVSYVQRSFGGYSSADALLMPFSDQSQESRETHSNVDLGSVSSSLVTTSPILENNQVSPNGSCGNGLATRKNLRSKQRPSIELVMENGISLKLEAYSSDTCDQWVSCLSDLVIYSKARVEADRDIHSNNKLTSSFDSDLKLHCKNDGGVDVSKFGPCFDGYPDATHTFIDTRIWSICPFTQCKDIVKSGIMYVQSKDTFSQKQFVLTMDGRLHYYSMYKRSKHNGQPMITGVHERKGTLDLANAYVYSGLTSVMDWKTSRPQPDRPPRLFKNGMTAKDSDQDCLLTVWIPKRRRIFSPKRQRIMIYGAKRRFNSSGARWLFLTPSRVEKEEWVWGINTIQEHLHRKASCINNYPFNSTAFNTSADSSL